MPKQPTLRPSDVVVALQLTISPSAQFQQLAESTGISAGECHNAVRRLRLSGLVLPEERSASSDAMHQFVVQGLPFAFPSIVGPGIMGVVTAHSSPAFRGIIESPDHFVWADADGPVRGQSLIPLFPGAPALASRNPPLYELLTIVDALRVGTTRVRKVAAELLAARLAAARA
jgi:hypothetical protein